MIFFRRFPPIMALLVIVSFFYLEPAWGRGAYPYRFPDPKLGFDPQANTVIGVPGEYVTRKKDTLLDVARDNNLGFNEIGKSLSGNRSLDSPRRHQAHHPYPMDPSADDQIWNSDQHCGDAFILFY